jgi:hypothetical protein
MFTGKFTATFIGNAASAGPNSNKSECFGITELNNIKCTESRRIIEEEMNQLLQNHKIMKIGKMIQTESVAFPVLGGIEHYQIDWGSFRFYNPVFSGIHRINRGFVFKDLKNFKLIDGALSIILNVILFLPRLFVPKLIPEFSSEIYVGYIEADFVCRVLP